MVKKYKKKRNYRKGGYRQRKYTVKKKEDIGTLIADTTKVTMKYNDDIVLSVGPTGDNYYFRCNSIYDPDLSSTGHQPMGRDQFQQFYKRYVVIGAKITARFIADAPGSNTNDVQAQCTNVGISLIPSSSDSIVNPNDFMENNRTIYTTVTPQQSVKMLTSKFSAKEFFGVSKVLDEEELGAQFGTNPVNEAIWQIKAWPVVPGGPSRRIGMNIGIQYICVLRERQPILGS